MSNCGQACPYNTLDGCKVKEHNAICPLTNMATPIKEYQMTNADRIRSMSDEEIAQWLCLNYSCTKCPGQNLCTCDGGKHNGLTKWLKQPAEEDNHA